MSVKKQSIPERKDFQNSYKDMRQRTYVTWMRLGSFLELCQTSLCHKRLLIAQEERDQRREEKPIIIGKSANPRCFRGVSDRATFPWEYFSQPKAWMESGILTEILRKVNARLRNVQ